MSEQLKSDKVFFTLSGEGYSTHWFRPSYTSMHIMANKYAWRHSESHDCDHKVRGHIYIYTYLQKFSRCSYHIRCQAKKNREKKDTVKSYLNESSSPPWSAKSYISLESSPYLPVNVSYNAWKNVYSIKNR